MNRLDDLPTLKPVNDSEDYLLKKGFLDYTECRCLACSMMRWFRAITGAAFCLWVR